HCDDRRGAAAAPRFGSRVGTSDKDLPRAAAGRTSGGDVAAQADQNADVEDVGNDGRTSTGRPGAGHAVEVELDAPRDEHRLRLLVDLDPAPEIALAHRPQRPGAGRVDCPV